MSNSRSKSDLVELKRQALAYFSMNSDIPKKVEEALNSLFYESPYDAYGYLSEYFQNYSKPAFISRICAEKSVIYDSKSQPTFRVNLYCQDRNRETKLLSLECPCYTFDVITDLAKIQLIEEDDNARSAKLDETRQLINCEINSLVRHHSPFNQDEIDEKLGKFFKKQQAMLLEEKDVQELSSRMSISQQAEIKTPTSPKQKQAGAKSNQKSSTKGGANFAAAAAAQEETLNLMLQCHYYPSYIQAFISKLVCLASSDLTKKILFEYICDLFSIKRESYAMPIPLVTILQSGKGFTGKQNLIKEFILMPKSHISFQKGIELISKVNRQLRDTLYQSKQQSGAVNKNITEIGCYTCTLDTVQQGLDLIESSITSACGTSAADLSITLNIAASEIFDYEKNKYEITYGGFKSNDELIELYSDLIAKYPRITMIIEPFIPLDHLSWYKLYLKISNYCLIGNNIKVNDNFNQPTEPNKVIELLNPRSLEMPVNFYRFENAVTLSSLMKKLAEKSDRNLYTGLSCSTNETDDSFISDLSVANQVKFLRVGGLNRKERVTKINRLIDIEQYLVDNKILVDPKDTSHQLKFSSALLDIPTEYAEQIKSLEEAAQSKKTLKQNKNTE